MSAFRIRSKHFDREGRQEKKQTNKTENLHSKILDSMCKDFYSFLVHKMLALFKKKGKIYIFFTHPHVIPCETIFCLAYYLSKWWISYRMEFESGQKDLNTEFWIEFFL